MFEYMIWNLYYKWFVNHQSGQTLGTNITVLLTYFLVARKLLTIKSKSYKYLVKRIEDYVCI